MTHDTFGKLRYKDSDESWAGYAPLPRFAAVGIRPDPPPMTEEEMAKLTDDLNSAVENMKNLMRERFGDKAAEALDAVDRAAEDAQREVAEGPEDPDPREEERDQRRALRRQKHAERLARGRFPIRIAGPGGEEPTPRQEAAFRHLLDNEEAVHDAVLAQVWDSFQNAYDQEHWRQMNSLKPAADIEGLKDRFAVTRLDIAREARGGFAHLIFLIESEWQDEHGLMVVYSPDTRAATWTTWDGLFDLLDSDDPADQPEEYVPTPHDQLLEAILTGDERGARELVAAGADINALGPDEYPPLWISVDQLEVEEVRRLLAFGADPSLRNEDEKTTPLRHAKKMYREMGFGPAKKQDAMMEGILSIMKEAAGKQFDDIKRRLEEIIKLLEDAGATA